MRLGASLGPRSPAVGRVTGLSPGSVRCRRRCPEGREPRAAPDTRTGPGVSGRRRPLALVGLFQYQAPGANGHLRSTPAEGPLLPLRNPCKQRPGFPLPFLHQLVRVGLEEVLETKSSPGFSAFCPGASRDPKAGMVEAI